MTTATNATKSKYAEAKTAKLAAMFSRLATALRTTEEKRVWSRVFALDEYDTCGRCGGSGNYSYCQMHGTTCFGCSGSGKKYPKLTIKLCERIENKVANGELDAYLTQCKTAAAASAAAKNAIDRLFAAWESQPELVADKASGKHWTEQTELTSAINTVCAAVYDSVKQDSFEMKDGKRYEGRTAISLTTEEKTNIANRLILAIQLVAKSQSEIEAFSDMEPKEAAEIVKTEFLRRLSK